MKERPILFSGPMVSAIRENKKTQTRRLVDPKAKPGASLVNLRGHTFDLRRDHHAEAALKLCPYGVAGDRLWVRETWASPSPGKYVYRASVPMGPGLWSPSIHMPRTAARIFLDVASVRLERLQDISEADAIAESCAPLPAEKASARDVFAGLWDEINGARATWESNPWVWVVSFRRSAP